MEHSTSQIDFLIGEWVHDELDRHILHRRMIDNATYESIAEECNRSTNCIKSRAKRARGVLDPHL